MTYRSAALAVFTGIVEGRGIVQSIQSDGAAIRIQIEVPDAMLGSAVIGDSVAINGCCLTAIEIEGDRWSFEAGEETLTKTNLGEFERGHLVNLECSLPVNGRLGGHFVQGHIDGVGYIDSIDQDGEWATYWFRVAEELARQMVPKGSVAIDGISLTLVNVEHDRFSVALIPHTLEVTTLGQRKVGQAVNIETDILGKYVQKLLQNK